eukprot:4959719-Prymnesium_polylepis.1
MVRVRVVRVCVCVAEAGDNPVAIGDAADGEYGRDAGVSLIIDRTAGGAESRTHSRTALGSFRTWLPTRIVPLRP